MSLIKLTAGDTRPPVLVHITDPAGPVDVSASNVVVTLKFRAKGDDTVLVSVTGTKLPGTLERDGFTPDLTLYPVAGSGGRVQFDFPDGSLNVQPGYYEGEVEVTANGSALTPHNRLEFWLVDDM